MKCHKWHELTWMAWLDMYWHEITWNYMNWHKMTWKTWIDMNLNEWHDMNVPRLTSFPWLCNESRRHGRGTYLFFSSWPFEQNQLPFKTFQFSTLLQVVSKLFSSCFHLMSTRTAGLWPPLPPSPSGSFRPSCYRDIESSSSASLLPLDLSPNTLEARKYEYFFTEPGKCENRLIIQNKKQTWY
jgi:hypothetical protein